MIRTTLIISRGFRYVKVSTMRSHPVISESCFAISRFAERQAGLYDRHNVTEFRGGDLCFRELSFIPSDLAQAPRLYPTTFSMDLLLRAVAKRDKFMTC